MESAISNSNKETMSVLQLKLENKAKLYAAYMPFIKGGGLFVPTSLEYAMGQEVTLEIALMEEPTAYVATGVVVWLTPRDAQRGKTPGIGVQLTGETAVPLRSKIENYLIGVIDSATPTETM